MSDSEDSTVTYTVVSSPFGGLSDFGSSGVNGPPVMPEDPYAYVVASFQAPLYPDCVPGPVYPPSPDIVLKPVYSEFMPPKDEDPKEVLEEDDDEDPKENPADYLADGRDDGDAEDESFDDEEDDDALSAEETEPFETNESMATPPPHPAYYVARLLAIPTPPPSPLSPWSSPLPQIPSLPLPVSPLPTSPNYPLGYRAAMIRLRVEALSTSYSPPPHITRSHTRADTPPSRTPPVLPIPLPTSSLPLHLLSTDRRADRPKVTLPPQKRLNIALGPRYKGDYAGSKEMSVMRSPALGMRCGSTTQDIYPWTLVILHVQNYVTAYYCIGSADSDYRVAGQRTERHAAITEVLAAGLRETTQFIEALKLAERDFNPMKKFERQQDP
ncbi:hypothetical protein Tco_0998034 [Tanacetum coccineum]